MSSDLGGVLLLFEKVVDRKPCGSKNKRGRTEALLHVCEDMKQQRVIAKMQCDEKQIF